MKNNKFYFLGALFALITLFSAGCSPSADKCTTGTKQQQGQVYTNVALDDKGIYSLTWDAVPGATSYLISTINESVNPNLVLVTDTVRQPQPLMLQKTFNYTCDSFLFRVKPVVPNATLCLPDGEATRVSRTRGGIIIVIVERTTGNTCSAGTNPTLQYFNNNGFIIGSTPLETVFSDSLSYNGYSRTINKLQNNADHAAYLKVIVKNCSGLITATHQEYFTVAQAPELNALKGVIIGAVGRAGIAAPATNTNAYIEKIRFEK